MTQIVLLTEIDAGVETVFDRARDIGLHSVSAVGTNEKAVAGRLSGLISLNETVTWRGKHFGMMLKHETKITAFDFPNSFTDEMISGQFKRFHHRHLFELRGGKTVMTDLLTYEVPFGLIGRFFDLILLRRHMTDFLLRRNQVLKETSEEMKDPTGFKNL